VLELAAQLNSALMSLVSGVIRAAPIAVGFLVCSALLGATDLGALFRSLGLLVAANLCGYVLHAGLLMPLAYWLVTFENPYSYMRGNVPALTFAFGCASSGATLPVTLRCIENSGVPASVARSVATWGAVINMDGSGIYYTVSVLWLAQVGGQAGAIDAGAYLRAALMASVGSVGSSPIPNAGLILLLTVWQGVFRGVPLPAEVAYLYSLDWLLDRFITAVNVNGDMLVSRATAIAAGLVEAGDFTGGKGKGMGK